MMTHDAEYGGPFSILYVDDDPGMARLFQKRLTRAGYVVDLAFDGEEGLAKWLAGSYDLLAVDHDMPRKNGLEVLRELADMGPLPPIIMITGHGSETIAVEALKLGAEDYVMKDVEGRHLDLVAKRIEEACARRRIRAEKRRAEEALARSEREFRAAFDQAAVGMCHLDLAGRFLRVNQRLVDMLGYRSDELTSLKLYELTHPHDLGTDVVHMRQLLSHAIRSYSTEKRCMRKGGSLLWVNLTVSLVCNESGAPGYFFGVLEDITHRKKAEETLKEREETLRLFIEHAPTALAMFDREMRYMAASRRWRRDYRLSHEEIEGRCHYDIFPESSDRCKAVHQRGLAGEVVGADNDYFERADGSVQWLRWEVRPWYTADGEIGGIVIFSEDTTERRRAEDAIQRSEATLRAVLDQLPSGVTVSDAATGKLIASNERARALMGDKGNVPDRFGHPCLGTSGSTDSHGEGPVAGSGAAGEGVQVEEVHMVRADGSEITLSVSSAPVRDWQGRVTMGVRVFHDITERKHQEYERELTVDFLRLVNESRGVRELIRSATAFLKQRLGCDAIGIRLREGDDYPYFETQGLPAKFVRLENRLCEVDANGSPRRDAKGNPVLACMCGAVISGRFDPSKPFFTPRGSFWTNSTSELLATTTPKERLSRTRNRCNGEGYESVALIPLRSGDQPWGLVQFNDRRKGRFNPEFVALLERLAQYLTVALEKFKAEESLSRQTDTLEAIFETAPFIMMVVNEEGRVQKINHAGITFSGRLRDELIGLLGGEIFGCINCLSGDTCGRHEICAECSVRDTIRHTFRTGKPVFQKESSLTVSKESGEQVFSFLISTALLHLQGSRTVLVTMADITDRKEAEKSKALLQRQLLQAQKMESIATLAGGIAHDFNNLLQIVLGYSGILLYDKQPSDREYEDLRAIRQAARDGADLAKRILAFSRRLEPNVRPINLNHEIRRMEKMLTRTVPKMIRIELLLSDDLMNTNADPGQIEQILLNLAVNAQHAMPEGGKLTIGTTNVTLEEEYCRTEVGVEPGHYALLSVSDTGHGMEKQVLERMYEPFFTTKGKSEGTGLGLAMVYGIVKSHRGHITCESEPNQGTTFNIFLPAIVQEMHQDVGTTVQMPALGTEGILFVDDEIHILSSGEKILSLAGYSVWIATNGREALHVYEAHRNKIDLVILDMIMPEMGGKQCLEELLKIDPNVKVIIASGYSVNGQTEKALQTGAKEFISKPYEANKILRLVRQVLDQD